jgi:Tol biopolymer transport system component
VYHLVFSPAGREIAATVDDSSGRHPSRVIAVALAGGRVRTISTTQRREQVAGLDWSPGGRRLVYVVQHYAHATVAESLREGIWTIGSDGRSARHVSGSGDAYPRWSPDGRRIAFLGACQPPPWPANYDPLGLCTMRPGGSGRRAVVVSDPYDAAQPLSFVQQGVPPVWLARRVAHTPA